MIVNMTSHKFLTITDFFKTLQECLYADFGKDSLGFYSAYPNATDAQNISTPLVTYYYKQGLFNFQRATEIKGRRAPESGKVFKSAQGEEVYIEFKRQRFLYDITLEIWETSGHDADEVANRIRRLIASLTGYFKKLGVSELIFKELDGAQPDKKWKTDLTVRRLKYDLSMDEFTSIYNPLVSAFDIEGTVYKSRLHLFGKEGTDFGPQHVEKPVGQDPVAASTPNVAFILPENQDSLEIHVVKNDE